MHYSVQLNNSESPAWEPIRSDRQKDTGRLAIWYIDWERFQPAKWVTHLEKEQIKKALSQIKTSSGESSSIRLIIRLLIEFKY